MNSVTAPEANTPLLLDAGRSERGWHRIENMLRCPRLYAWSEMVGVPWVVSSPLVNGSLIHIALAHHYQRMKERTEGGDPNKWMTPEEAIQALAEKNCSESALWLGAVPQITEAYRAYRDNWIGEQWEVISVEEELRARLGQKKYLYTQRADLIARDENGRVWIIDHKSCYRIVSKTLRQHILDGQFLGYQMFGRARFGDDFAGVLVNRIKLSAPFDFDRRSLEPAPHALDGFVKSIVKAEEQIEEYGDCIDDFPMVLSNQTCYGKYGQCSAFDLCRFGPPLVSK